MTTIAPLQALHEISGFMELSHLGVIRAVGVDAATFLQGQLTQDVVNMSPGCGKLAAFCNAKGRMQASFVVFKRINDDATDELLMVCSADILSQTLKRLSMFVMRAKVKLADASADFMLYGVVGDAVHTALPVDQIDSGAGQAPVAWSKYDFDGVNAVSLYPGAGIQRMLWCAPKPSAPPQGAALPLSIWHWLDVQSGVAMITQPIFEAFVPQMLNYESVGGVNFKKGCYPGQEVVARSQFRGTLKRRAYLLHSAVEPHVGQEVFHSSDADQPCGAVAAYGANPSGGFDAIVSMQTAAAQAGQLKLAGHSTSVLALLPLPYPLLEDI